jgi:hypothetical protein
MLRDRSGKRSRLRSQASCLGNVYAAETGCNATRKLVTRDLACNRVHRWSLAYARLRLPPLPLLSIDEGQERPVRRMRTG